MTGILLKVDDAGWRVPQTGTVSFKIYELSKAGKKPKEIAETLGIKVESVRILKWKMSHPLDNNRRARDWHRASAHKKKLSALVGQGS